MKWICCPGCGAENTIKQYVEVNERHVFSRHKICGSCKLLFVDIDDSVYNKQKALARRTEDKDVQ